MPMSNEITRRIAVICILIIGLGCGGNDLETEVSEAAAVIITAPAENDVVAGSVRVVLSTRNVEVRPAGTVEAGTGHHHLFIDRDITPIGEPIPVQEGIVHLGMAQTEHMFENLAPGEHMIIAVLGDHIHSRLADAATDTVRVTVGES